jgi:hypothetical protein
VTDALLHLNINHLLRKHLCQKRGGYRIEKEVKIRRARRNCYALLNVLDHRSQALVIAGRKIPAPAPRRPSSACTNIAWWAADSRTHRFSRFHQPQNTGLFELKRALQNKH